MHVKRRIIIPLTLLFVILFITIYIYSNILKDKLHLSDYPPKTLNLENFNLNQNDKFYIQDKVWTLSIPILNLYNIPIIDSIEVDKLEDYIGHFPISSYLQGNICLAAHNDGFRNNYFKDINTLCFGDKIIYSYEGREKEYFVDKIYTIDNTDFSFISLDSKDKITLVTCVSNSPLKRLCVEAVNKE